VAFCDRREHSGVADVLSLLEVGAEQLVDDRRGEALLLRELDEAVGGDRVGRALHALERELDALAPSLGGDARVELAAALDRAELGLAVLGARHALRRHVRIELERQPADLRLDLILHQGQRFFEAALADIAPGADDVGGDFDRQGFDAGIFHGRIFGHRYCFFAGIVQK
jgi:hypothetical protein